MRGVSEVFSWYSRVLNLPWSGRAGCNELYYVGILAEPAVTSDFEQVGSLAWVGDEDSAEEIAGMWCDVFREC